MCGIVGRIKNGTEGHDLRVAETWLARRGPDSRRVWQSADARVDLLHARLAIVDKDTRANQPMVDETARVAIVMNGEIYNYREYRTELTSYRFRTESDTEVALGAYVTRGIAGLSGLKGMYALVIVDERARRVIVARDAVGKKPLFMARWDGETLVGSSLLALVAVHGSPVRLATDVESGYWEEAFIAPDTAALAGASPVLPGEVIELDWSGSVVSRGRHEPPPALVYAGESAADVRSNVETLVERSVARRLDSNPNPMALLSGGIDSTVVTVTAARLLDNDAGSGLRTLTLGAAVPGTNDERYARYAARRIGTPITVLRPHRANLADAVRGAMDLQDEPLGMASFFLLARLVAAAAEHGRILLSGDGGDEVFLGYRPPAEWRKGSAESETSPAVLRVAGDLPGWMGTWGRKVASTTLLGHMMAKADRASAEQGVELRCPLLDWDLIRYARSLPYDLVAGRGTSKALLADQLREWPAWFVDRRKRGFTYNLRWVWGARKYAGLRELVDERTVATFRTLIPAELGSRPQEWTTAQIFRHFSDVWKLAAWSRFLERVDRASRPQHVNRATEVVA